MEKFRIEEDFPKANLKRSTQIIGTPFYKMFLILNYLILPLTFPIPLYLT